MTTLVRHPVHRALTRPQMFAGVTYNYFIINGMVTTEAFLITGSWLALLVFAVCVSLICWLSPATQVRQTALISERLWCLLQAV